MFVMVIVNCVPTPVAPIVTPTLSPTSTPTILPIATPLPTSTSLTPTSQPLHFYFPEVEKRCPENREVPVNKLGIDSDWQVILSDLDQTGLWNLDSKSLSPELIQELPMDKWMRKSISPDGKWLAYTTWNPDSSLSTWLLSLDSGEQREIININYLEGASSSASWLSQNELLVVGNCAGAGCPFPLKVINIDTGESLDVSDVDREPNDEYQTFYIDAGRYYALYSERNGGDDYINFYVYDYVTHQKIHVFPWLQNRIFFYPYVGTNLGLEFGQDKIFMMVEQSYGYDLGIVNVSTEALTQNVPYDALMKRVFTDLYFGELDFSFIVLNPLTNSLILSVSYKDSIHNDFGSEPKDIEDAFFVIDLENPMVYPPLDYLVFTDYCFSTTGYYPKGISPDGKVVVFDSGSELTFLNMETGKISRLPDWSFIGWSRIRSFGFWTRPERANLRSVLDFPAIPRLFDWRLGFQ
jgi:hypothetical protein